MSLRPQLWVIGGPNGAGKSTLVSRRLAARIPVVNPDDIAVDLPRIDGRLDEREAGKLALQTRNRLLAAGESFAIETTLTGHSAVRFMEAARSRGYKTTLVFVGLRNAGLSASRVAIRFARGGHAVPISALQRRYPQAIAHLPLALEFADRAFILDNSADRRRLLMVIENGRSRFLGRELPDWFQQILPEIVKTGSHG